MKMEGVTFNLVMLECDQKDLPYFLSRLLVLFLQLVLPVPFNDKMKCEQKTRNSWTKTSLTGATPEKVNLQKHWPICSNPFQTWHPYLLQVFSSFPFLGN